MLLLRKIIHCQGAIADGAHDSCKYNVSGEIIRAAASTSARGLPEDEERETMGPKIAFMNGMEP